MNLRSVEKWMLRHIIEDGPRMVKGLYAGERLTAKALCAKGLLVEVDGRLEATEHGRSELGYEDGVDVTDIMGRGR